MQERSRKEIILLVDDDSAVRYMVGLVLRRYGYTVLEADSAESAIPLWERASEKIDLLITDNCMPGMTGVELTKVLRLKKSQLSVLLISGYRPDRPGDTVDWPFPMSFLAKPFSAGLLLEEVRKTLDCQVLREECAGA